MPVYRGITFDFHGSYDDTRYPYDEGDAEPLNFSQKHVENLIDMAAAMRDTPPPKFNMAYYGRIEHRTSMPNELRHIVSKSPDPSEMFQLGQAGKDVAHSCGTSCCALGTAAFFGIGHPAGVGMPDDWDDFSYQTFGIDHRTSLWTYLFDGDWSAIDNTAEGAAARVLSVVMMGTHELFTAVWDRTIRLAEVLEDDYKYRLGHFPDDSDFYRAALEVYAKYKDVPINA